MKKLVHTLCRQRTLDTVSIAMTCINVMMYSTPSKLVGTSHCHEPHQRYNMLHSQQTIPIAVDCISGHRHASQPATYEIISIVMNCISASRHTLQPANSWDHPHCMNCINGKPRFTASTTATMVAACLLTRPGCMQANQGCSYIPALPCAIYWCPPVRISMLADMAQVCHCRCLAHSRKGTRLQLTGLHACICVVGISRCMWLRVPALSDQCSSCRLKRALVCFPLLLNLAMELTVAE